MTTWKANGSATPPSSAGGAPTVTRAHAPTRNSNSRSLSASPTSFRGSAPVLAEGARMYAKTAVTQYICAHSSRDNRDSDGDGQRRQPAQRDVRLVLRLAVQARVGETRRQRRQGNAGFQPRQRRPQAIVRATTKP